MTLFRYDFAVVKRTGIECFTVKCTKIFNSEEEARKEIDYIAKALEEYNAKESS